MFQAFTQADSSTTRRFVGTGLGLAICRRLVELMDGKIGVISAEGQGSTFWFDVRLAKAASSRGIAQASPTGTPPHTEPRPGKCLRVLLVEDNRVNRKVAVAQLRKLGCAIEIAANGIEAVDAWERGSFDVILMDCHMPAMDGFEATRKIRALERERSLPATPIVAMTANAMEGDRESCLRAGMDYLSKPVDEVRLEALLTKCATGPCFAAGAES